jgi:hypothetical protein
MEKIDPKLVSVVSSEKAEYPRDTPFHPHRLYPENSDQKTGDETNHVYEAVRRCFELAGLDAERFDICSGHTQ